MDLPVKEFVDELLKEEAAERPSDTVKAEDLVMKLPEDFDEEKFNSGRRFYWDNCFMLGTTMMLGLVAVMSVPSILNVLVNSRRSSSVYTAYKRYVSTLLHVESWFKYELRPGTVSWRSLHAVRSRHVRASLSAKSKGLGIVSQRDLALTMFGFIGFSVLKPDEFGITSIRKDDWEDYNYFWRVIGHMIGMEDRYNICRKTFHETRDVCQLLRDRIFTPCMENPPEYFEHMARSMLEGMTCMNIVIDLEAVIFNTKRMCEVPGYVYRESERLALQRRLREQLKGKSEDIGVDVTDLMSKPDIQGLPAGPPRLLYLRDYDTMDTVPSYKRLSAFGKFKLYFITVSALLYTTYLGRLYYNLNFIFSLFLMNYFPYLAFIKFGVRPSYVNIFVEDPVENVKLKTNAEYYNTNNNTDKETTWYKEVLSIFK